MASASQGVTNVSYPQNTEITLKVSFECSSKDEQDYLTEGNPGFLADIFDIWNNHGYPPIVEINGLTHQQIKQRMLGMIL